jgi:peptide/nickel transport system substrate-binding protein
MGFSTSELVRDYWQEVGVKVNYKQISDELNHQLTNSNQLDLVTWVAESYLPTRLSPQRFGTGSSGYAVHWNDWLDHESWIERGRQGEEPPRGQEPPSEWKRYMQDRIDWNGAASDAEFSRLGREVFAQHADLLPVIGTVAKVLRPIIINDRVRNVPDTLPFAFETLLWTQPTPMQWFIRE